VFGSYRLLVTFVNNINYLKNTVRYGFSVLLLAISLFCGAQQNATCECQKDLAFTANYLENHYAGFQDNVTDRNIDAYNSLKNELNGQATNNLPETQCFLLLKKYLNFFRDNHLQIRFKDTKAVDEKSEIEVNKFRESSIFKSRERILNDSIKTWRYLELSLDPIEGIYENDVYQVAVVKDNQSDFRDYYGYITNSKTQLWDAGQVKFEIKRVSISGFQTILFMRNHSIEVKTVDAINPVFGILDVKKIYPVEMVIKKTDRKDFSLPPDGNWFQFKVLDSSTSYLHIKSFHGSLKRKIDSALIKAIPIFAKRPNLIIDIRNNGGGSDQCWELLEKYIYTQPYEYGVTEYYCSPEIIKRNEEYLSEMKRNRKEYGWGAIAFSKIKLRKIRKAKAGTYLTFKEIIPWWARPFVNSTSYKQKKVYKYPEKIIVVYNRNTASSAEGLILSAMNSKKVLTFGENSGGYIAFGDVRLTNTPSGFVLQSATQRTRNRFPYEKIGIPPKVKAETGEDWVEQSKKLLTNFSSK
jgi:hypothetical protein